MSNITKSHETPEVQAPLQTIPQKLYYKIGEVGEITGVPAHVLRFWEKQFPQLAPNKTRSGHRLYKKKDILLVLRIKDLLYAKRFTIKGAREHLASSLPEGPALSAGPPGEMLGRLREGLLRIHERLSRPNPFDS